MTYKYWIAASLTNNVNELTFLSALINGIGAIGSTMGFVISTMKFNLVGACAINLTLFFLATPGLFYVVYYKVQETSHGTSLTNLEDIPEDSDDQGSVSAGKIDGAEKDVHMESVVPKEKKAEQSV